jgi:hypothetical protein
MPVEFIIIDDLSDGEAVHRRGDRGSEDAGKAFATTDGGAAEP